VGEWPGGKAFRNQVTSRDLVATVLAETADSPAPIDIETILHPTGSIDQ
jgi:hypothetical protein